MAFAFPLHTAFRDRPALTNLGDVYDCAINGRPFRFDREHEAFKQGMQSISVLRQQSDTSSSPGEASINREDLWRSAQSSWHKGAGQRYLDKEDSDKERFWASQGIDVWTRDELSLLDDTEATHVSASTNANVIAVGSYLYIVDGATVRRSTTGASGSWTSCTGITGTISSIATNGFNTWVTTPTATYVTDTTGTAFSSYLGSAYELVAYTRGRLLVAHNENISEVVAGPTAQELNPSEGNTALRWTAITSGANTIYASTVSGDRSQIYRISPPADDPSGDLGVPIPAAPPLPTGETISALYGYLGQLLIGTSKGVRVAEEDQNGNLVIGALIKTPQTVSCFDGAGSYVYFGWTNFDSTHTGLGRLDLSVQTNTGVYAYASDVQALTQGAIGGVANFADRQHFAVQGHGIYRTTNTPVDSGWLQSGLIRYGIPDSKIVKRVELRHSRLSGSVEVSLSVDESDFETVGTSSLEGTVSPIVAFDVDDISGSKLEYEVTLEAGTDSPVVEHIDLRSAVSPVRGSTFLVPVVLTYEDSEHVSRHPLEDFDTLVAMARYQRSVTYQEHSKVFDVVLQDYQWERGHVTVDGTWENGTMVLKFFNPDS